MNDGQLLAVEQSASGKTIDRMVEQRPVPPVEKVSGYDEMVRPSCDDAVELSGECDRIAFIAKV